MDAYTNHTENILFIFLNFITFLKENISDLQIVYPLHSFLVTVYLSSAMYYQMPLFILN